MKENNKRPSDRMWPLVLPLVAILFVVAGVISQHNGIYWMCIFLGIVCNTVSITTSIVSALDDNLYWEIDTKRQELQRQVASLQQENEHLEETNRELEKKIRALEDANLHLKYLKRK